MTIGHEIQMETIDAARLLRTMPHRGENWEAGATMQVAIEIAKLRAVLASIDSTLVTFVEHEINKVG